MRRLFRFSLAAALAVLVASPTFPAPAQPSLSGVWDGTVGDKPVRVCFDQREWGGLGAYYYLSHLRSIPLQSPQGQKHTFVEGYDEKDTTSPRWVIERLTPQEIGGSWSQGGRILALHLARVSTPRGDTEGTSCSSMAFNAARLQGVRTIRRAATKDGVAYTRLILDHRGHFGDDVGIETFALIGDTPPVRRINAELGKPLQSEDWFECVRSALDANGFDGDSSETLEPRMITRRWLSVMDESGWYCGGAHPDDSVLPRLFDRETGREIDLHQWLNAKAVTRTDELIALRPELRNLILRRHKTDSECTDTVNEENYWTIELTRTGLIFTPSLPHVAVGCRDEYLVPFPKLRPYLRPEAQREIAALEAEIASRR